MESTVVLMRWPFLLRDDALIDIVARTVSVLSSQWVRGSYWAGGLAPGRTAARPASSVETATVGDGAEGNAM